MAVLVTAVCVRYLSEVTTVQDLQEESLQRFVLDSFEHAVISNEWLECQFARTKQWLARSLKPLSISQLGARYCNHHWGRLHERRDDSDSGSSGDGATSLEKGPRSKKIIQPKKQPLWAKRPRKLTGEHVFLSAHMKQKGERRNLKDFRGKVTYYTSSCITHDS